MITFPKTLLLEDFIDTYASVAFLSSTSYRRHSPCLLTYNPALRKGFGLRWAQHPSRQAESIRCPDNFYPGSRTTWVLWTIKNYHQPRHGSNVLCLMAQPRNGPLLRLVFSREVFLDHYSLQFSLMISRMRPKESLRTALYVDGTKIFNCIGSEEDCKTLQTTLSKMEHWSKKKTTFASMRPNAKH